jgi:hypothetical protein
MSVVPSFGSRDELERFFQRVMRPVRGGGGITVKDGADGLSIVLNKLSSRNAPGEASGAITTCLFKEEFESYIRCREFVDGEETSNDVYVLKPAILWNKIVGSTYYPTDRFVFAATLESSLIDNAAGDPITLIDISTIYPGSGQAVGSTYSVLQVNPTGIPVWDWVRAH